MTRALLRPPSRHQVVKEHKLYGTYEQFFASDSQTFLVKKYARVCIVSDEFLARALRTPAPGKARARAGAVGRRGGCGLCSRCCDLTCGCAVLRAARGAGSRPQHGAGDSHDHARRGAPRAPVLLSGSPPRRRACRLSGSDPPPQVLAKNGFDVTLLYTRGQLSEAADVDFWATVRVHARRRFSGPSSFRSEGATEWRSRKPCCLMPLHAPPQFFASKKIRFVPLPDTSIAYDVPEPVRRPSQP